MASKSSATLSYRAWSPAAMKMSVPCSAGALLPVCTRKVGFVWTNEADESVYRIRIKRIQYDLECVPETGASRKMPPLAATCSLISTCMRVNKCKDNETRPKLTPPKKNNHMPLRSSQ